MKKKIAIFLSSIIIIAIVLSVSFISYGNYKAKKYVKRYSEDILKVSNSDAKTDVELDKIIKETPTNLIISVKWRDNEKAYISIKNWIVDAPNHITIDIVDKNKHISVFTD